MAFPNRLGGTVPYAECSRGLAKTEVKEREVHRTNGAAFIWEMFRMSEQRTHEGWTEQATRMVASEHLLQEKKIRQQRPKRQGAGFEGSGGKQ